MAVMQQKTAYVFLCACNEVIETLHDAAGLGAAAAGLSLGGLDAGAVTAAPQLLGSLLARRRPLLDASCKHHVTAAVTPRHANRIGHTSTAIPVRMLYNTFNLICDNNYKHI